MNYSSQLIDKFKEIKGIKTDTEVAELIPEMNKGNLSKIRKGLEGRHLSEMQALWIAQQCQLDAALVLVELAAECAKTTTAQTVWHDLAKKLRATAKVLVVATILVISGTSGHFSPRIRHIP